MRAPEILSRLDAVRVRERNALRRARGPEAQERVVQALRWAHAVAAEELAPFAPAGSAPEQVVLSLRGTAEAYRLMAVAAHFRSRRAWARARTAVSQFERELKRDLAVA